MDDTFLTIASNSEGVYKEKGSKFLSFAYPVSSEEEVKKKIDFLRKKYFDASHHCFAYRLGQNGEHYRANDDGEPANSAGKPILGQLIAKDVTNVLIVVVRYFGGTLLGVGGLVQAYRKAAAAALANAETVTEIVTETYQLKFGYHVINQILKAVKDMNIVILRQDFNMIDEAQNEVNCLMNIAVRKSLTEEMKKRLETVDTLDIYSIT